MYSKLKKSLSLTALALLASNLANAVQLVPNADKQEARINISIHETNRLTVEGRRIATVVPALPGVIESKKDDATGTWYFTVSRDSAHKGTVTVFVTDDQGGSYKAILVPRPSEGEDIVLQPSAISAGGRPRAPEGRAVSYQRRVKDLILVMADEELVGTAVDKTEINKDVPLWQEGRLVLVAKYVDGDIVGEKYQLTNVSKADMLLVEQELYRRGVRAVSIKHMTLTPGDSTDIFIVRERKENE